MAETLTGRFGEFVAGLRYEDLPGEVIEKARTCLLHGMGVALASDSSEPARMARALAKETEATPAGVTLMVDGAKVTPGAAAFANAVLLHGRTQEDTHGKTHIGPVVIPAALAVAEVAGLTGRELLPALVAGYEVTAALSMPSLPYTNAVNDRGFRTSPVFCGFASTAAVCKLLGLDAATTANALGMAAALAFGTLESVGAGTSEWRFQVGVSSRNGLLAAELARRGANAAPGALEGHAGLFAAFAGITGGLESLGAHLGQRYEIMNVSFKPYPVGMLNMTNVAAMVELAKQADLRPEEIVRIVVEMNEADARHLGATYAGPFASAAQTLISVPYGVAVAALHRGVPLAALERFDDPATMAMVAKVQVVGSPRRKPLSTRVSVTTTDGRTVEHEITDGMQLFSIGFAEDKELVRSLAPDMAVPPAQLERLIAAIEEVEGLPVAELMTLTVRS